MLQKETIALCFALKHELPGVEFKGPGMGRDNPLFGKVVRAAMAMANRRSGGIIIIGISETATGLSFDGLTSEQLATWKYESVADGFNRHAIPHIEFDRHEYEHEGKTFLVLDIHEFASTPTMCIKEYRDKTNPKMQEKDCPIILRMGGFYIRTINKPESKEMLTGEESRNLIALAVEKGIQTFVTHTRLAGINIAPLPKDEELFAQQLKDWTGPILDEIRTRGYWDIRIHPVAFQSERLQLSQLRQIVFDAAMNYRGWEFPYNSPVAPETGLDWIGLENREGYSLQAWRFFQSGQFAMEAGLLDDWEDMRTSQFRDDWKPGEYLSILDVVYRLIEIFGLASRLAITDVYRDERSMVIDLTLCNVKNRTLLGRGTYQTFLPKDYTTSAESIPHTVTLAKEDLIGRPRELALEEAQFFFERFGYHPSKQLLTSMQSSI